MKLTDKGLLMCGERSGEMAHREVRPRPPKCWAGKRTDIPTAWVVFPRPGEPLPLADPLSHEPGPREPPHSPPDRRAPPALTHRLPQVEARPGPDIWLEYPGLPLMSTFLP